MSPRAAPAATHFELLLYATLLTLDLRFLFRFIFDLVFRSQNFKLPSELPEQRKLEFIGEKSRDKISDWVIGVGYFLHIVLQYCIFFYLRVH